MANTKLVAGDFSLSRAPAGDNGRAAPGQVRGKLSTRLDYDASGDEASLTYAFSRRASGSARGLELPLVTVFTLKGDAG